MSSVNPVQSGINSVEKVQRCMRWDQNTPEPCEWARHTWPCASEPAGAINERCSKKSMRFNYFCGKIVWADDVQLLHVRCFGSAGARSFGLAFFPSVWVAFSALVHCKLPGKTQSGKLKDKCSLYYLSTLAFCRRLLKLYL